MSINDIRHITSGLFQHHSFLANGEAFVRREAVLQGKEKDLRPVYYRDPDVLPVYDIFANSFLARKGHSFEDLLAIAKANRGNCGEAILLVLGQLTAIPETFTAKRIRGRGKGRGYKVVRTLALVHGGTRKAKGVSKDADHGRRQALDHADALAGFTELMGEDAALDGFSQGERALTALEAGKPVTGDETSWEDLM